MECAAIPWASALDPLGIPFAMRKSLILHKPPANSVEAPGAGLAATPALPEIRRAAPARTAATRRNAQQHRTAAHSMDGRRRRISAGESAR
jgi:hypothetical protein